MFSGNIEGRFLSDDSYQFERSDPPVWWEGYDIDWIFETEKTSLWDFMDVSK
jgi:hypothetical protein